MSFSWLNTLGLNSSQGLYPALRSDGAWKTPSTAATVVQLPCLGGRGKATPSYSQFPKWALWLGESWSYPQSSVNVSFCLHTWYWLCCGDSQLCLSDSQLEHPWATQLPPVATRSLVRWGWKALSTVGEAMTQHVSLGTFKLGTFKLGIGLALS